MTDQVIGAAVGERQREEEHPAFDLESTIAGHPSLPYRSSGHGASAFALRASFEDDDRARRCESRAMSQFGNSGDKIAQTVAVARDILQEGSFSATSGCSDTTRGRISGPSLSRQFGNHGESGYFRWYGRRWKRTS